MKAQWTDLSEFLKKNPDYIAVKAIGGPALTRIRKMKSTRRALFCGMRQSGQGWFRVLGFGLAWKDTRLHPLLFSERNGYRKGLRLGAWMFHLLTPRRY